MKLLSLSAAIFLAIDSTAAHSIRVQEPLHDVGHPSSSSSSSRSSSSNEALLSLHKSLVEHESITDNEHSVADFLTAYLRSHNFTVELQAVRPSPGSSSSPRRANILAYLGTTRKTRILVSSHIDTVPPFWPYERRGDEIWGRGSVDAKGSVASQVIAVEELITSGSLHEGDVALLYVVGEEVGGDGMQAVNLLGLSWEACIFGEPTELKLASGHKGIVSLEMRAKGKAGHSGYPELGKNANAMIIPALNKLLEMNLPWSEKYGNTTLNIGRIEGGVAANVIAEEASAKVAIRIAEGEPAAIKEIIEKTLEGMDEDLTVTFSGGYGPVYIDSDVPGFETIVVNYGTDIPNLKGDHKRYLYGPGTIMMAHSDHEHLKVSDLEEAVVGYKALIEHSLK